MINTRGNNKKCVFKNISGIFIWIQYLFFSMYNELETY